MTEEYQKKIERAVGIIGTATKELRQILPNRRETALSITKLEECAHWATASLAKESQDNNDIVVVPANAIEKPN